MIRIISTQYTLATRSFEIYLAGCNAQPHCKGCHSPETWDFNAGEPFTQDKRIEIQKKVREFGNLIDKIWILGGDPLDQDPEELWMTLEFLKAMTGKAIWLFTRHEPFVCRGENQFQREGDIKAEYTNFTKTLQRCDFVKTGAYIPELAADDYYVWFLKLATTNQKVWCKDGERFQRMGRI